MRPLKLTIAGVGPYAGVQELDFETLRTYLHEWRSIRYMLVKDMYVLTPWHAHDDRYGWTAVAYEDGETGEGLLLAFRQEDCEDESCTVKMEFAVPGAKYVFTDADTLEETVYSGEELANGITLSLPTPRSCMMKRILRKR